MYGEHHSRLIRTVMKWRPNKSRLRRTPRQRWKDRVEDDLKISAGPKGE